MRWIQETPACRRVSDVKAVVALCYLFKVAPERRFVLFLIHPRPANATLVHAVRPPFGREFPPGTDRSMPGKAPILQIAGMSLIDNYLSHL